MALLTPDGVSRLLRTTPASSNHLPPVLQIVALHRLALDDQWFAASKETERPLLGDAFDVTLSDGVHKVKCTLSTALNKHVYQGGLRPMHVVRLADWRHVVDERVNGTAAAPVLVVLTQLEPVRGGLPLINVRDDTEDPVVHPDARAGGGDACLRQTSELPLLGVRRYYVRLDSDEVLLTGRWTQGAAEEEAEEEAAAPTVEEAAVLTTVRSRWSPINTSRNWKRKS
jgi:hypothetical protein